MEKHRTRRGGYRYHYEITLPWDGVMRKDGIGKERPRALRNGFVREHREYKYRPTQWDGMYVRLGSLRNKVLHLLAPGMTPASACWKQVGDPDITEYRIYDKVPKSYRLCSYCWTAVEKEGKRRNG